MAPTTPRQPTGVKSGRCRVGATRVPQTGAHDVGNAEAHSWGVREAGWTLEDRDAGKKSRPTVEKSQEQGQWDTSFPGPYPSLTTPRPNTPNAIPAEGTA